ncbi:lipopolysaccharide biosynthesis protein [Acinetobacter haemolyticus]|uniref:Uncharacterized protein n=1 Tax=Acinetobacter haemolyticus TaxID=29430 RepID=A0AAJ3D7R9_ACIHA|nr:hypothetical protein [Acinetobacter haemolyticus]NAR73002.1 hypothetical protein [Acinetobacter haemolyticus]
MKNQIVDLGKLVVLNGITSLFAYFLTISIANILGPEDFGYYSFILIIGMFLSQFIIFSTDSTARFIANRDGVELAKYKILNLRVFGLIVALILIIIFGGRYTFLWAFGVMVVALSGLNLSFIYEWNKENTYYSLIYLVEKLFYIVSAFLVIYFLETIEIKYIFILLLSSTLFSLIFQYKKNNICLIGKFTRQDVKDIFFLYKSNLYIYMSTLLTFVYGGVGRIIIGNNYSMAELGKFSTAWQLIFIVTMFQAQVVKIWRIRIVDSISNKRFSLLKNITKEYFFITTLPIILLSLIVFLSSDYYFSLFFSDDYKGSVSYLRVISVYFIVINIEYYCGMLWSSVVNRVYNFVIYFFYSAVTLCLMVIFSNNLDIIYFISLIPVMHGLCVVTSIICFYIVYVRK